MESIESTFIEKCVKFLIIFTPIVDLLNGILSYKLDINSSILPGPIIRTIFLIALIMLYIKQKKKNILILFFLVMMFLIQEYIYSYFEVINFKNDLSFISKIWFNLILVLFLRQYYFKKELNYKVISSIVNAALIIGIVILISKFFNIGVNSYGDIGYKGLFIGLNDVTAVLTISMPFSLYQIIYFKKKHVNIAKFLIIFSSLILLGTKTGVIAAVLIIIYYIIFQIKGKNKYIKLFFMLVFCFILVFIFFRYFYEDYRNTILKRQMYFIQNLDIVSYLLSGRNNLAKIAFNYWITKWYYIVLGVGFTQGSLWISSFVENHGMIEMDLLDITYFYGIIMVLIFLKILLPIFLKSIKSILLNKNKLKNTFCIAFLIGFVISALGGHVILSPLAGVYFSIVFVYSEKLLRSK